MHKSLRTLRKLSGGPWLSKTGICSRQDAKSGSLISLRPLRLCARYSEFWLRRSRVTFIAVASLRSCFLMLVSNCVEYLLRRDRNIKQPHAAGVVHGIGNRGRRADVGMLTDAFGLVRSRPIF